MNHRIIDIHKKMIIRNDDNKDIGFLSLVKSGRTVVIGEVESIDKHSSVFYYILRDMPEICKELGVTKALATMEPHNFERFKKHKTNLNMKASEVYWDEKGGRYAVDLEITQGRVDANRN